LIPVVRNTFILEKINQALEKVDTRH